MRYRNLVIASGLTIAALAIVAVIASARLPADTQLPTHWGADGVADRFADADIALFMPVALALVLSLIMAAVPSLEPLQDRLEQSAPLHRTVWGALLAVMAVVEAMVAAPAFGLVLPATTMLIAMGVFFIVLGNALPKSRPGFFIGIRTPWAIVDADNWIATHRYGSRIIIAAGAALIVLALVPMNAEDRGSFVITILLAAVATPVVFSFFYWRVTRPRA